MWHTTHLLDRAHRCRRSASAIRENSTTARFATRETAIHQFQIAANLDALANELEQQAAQDLAGPGAGAEPSPVDGKPAGAG